MACRPMAVRVRVSSNWLHLVRKKWLGEKLLMPVIFRRKSVATLHLEMCPMESLPVLQSRQTDERPVLALVGHPLQPSLSSVACVRGVTLPCRRQHAFIHFSMYLGVPYSRGRLNCSSHLLRIMRVGCCEPLAVYVAVGVWGRESVPRSFARKL